MKFILKTVSRTILFVVLTAITQIGGIIYVLSFIISKKWKWNSKFKTLLVFTGLYLISTLFITPFLAPLFGREKIVHTKKIQPSNYFTVLLNRNYVQPQLNELLKKVENNLKGSDVTIHYLDANFPFIDQFPLLPHLSHNDGKKLDLSLIYETETGKISKRQKSISGYGVFEAPRQNEYNQIKTCLSNDFFQYDYPKYLTFGLINDELAFSESGTKRLISTLLKETEIEKIFIEPHLKERLNLKDNRVRYHGCKAVRHDDHIHIQLK